MLHAEGGETHWQRRAVHPDLTRGGPPADANPASVGEERRRSRRAFKSFLRPLLPKKRKAQSNAQYVCASIITACNIHIENRLDDAHLGWGKIAPSTLLLDFSNASPDKLAVVEKSIRRGVIEKMFVFHYLISAR